MSDIKTKAGFHHHLENKKYSIWQQKIICAHTDTVLHHEWLVRFDDNQRLDKIIRPAEISGAISDLDLTMLAEAIKALNNDENRPSIAVNVSGASLGNNGFKKDLLHILENLATSPDRLIFELTETWDLKDLSPAIEILDILRSRGHKLCLDDVGAGAASIRYLRAFPTDWLKIDGEFILASHNNERDRAVLCAIMSLREALNVRFIAEGIENEELEKFAKKMGFDALQGYKFGEPVKENINQS